MIRLANKEDIENINRLGLLLKKDFISTYNIKEYLNNSNYIILLNEEEIVNGLLIMYRNIGYYELEVIVVDANYRNKGVANNLLNYFISNYIKDEDILLEVAVNNDKAINLYKKNNFEIINTRKKYYKDIDAYVMKRVVK